MAPDPCTPEYCQEHDEKIRVLEDYKIEHDASINAWWLEQWKRNRDMETRLRIVERFTAKLMGAAAVAALVGAIAGGAVATLLAG